MAYSGAADYSSGAPDVGFWEGGDPLWVSVLVAVCVLAIIAVAECTGSVCSRRQSSRVEPTPRTPAGPTPSRRRRLRRQNEMTTIKLNNEDQHAEIVTLRGTHVEVPRRRRRRRRRPTARSASGPSASASLRNRKPRCCGSSATASRASCAPARACCSATPSAS